MPKYRVYMNTTASTVIVVEADDAELAIERAYDADMPRLCAQCAGWGQEHNLALNDVWEADESADLVEDDEA